MYKELSKKDLLKLNGCTLSKREYFIELLRNPNITNHQDGNNHITHRSKWVTVDDDEILIKVVI
jgi:hypothetical protein